MIISFHLFFSVVVAVNSFRLSFLILSFAPSLLSSPLKLWCYRRNVEEEALPVVCFPLSLSISFYLSLSLFLCPVFNSTSSCVR